MVRTQIQLSEEQARELKAEAAVRRTSMAELVRQAVELWLCSVRSTSLQERRRRALGITGKFKTGIPDLGANHDRHLGETL